MVAVRKDQNMSPRRGLNYVWVVVLQICHTYGVEVNREPRQIRENFYTNFTN
jgi:hypothetical protein